MGSTSHDRNFKLLRQAYSAETQLAAKLPWLGERAVSRELGATLARMNRETQSQLVRVEGILALLDQSTAEEPWHGMSVLLDEVAEAAQIQQASEREPAIALALAGLQHLVIVRYHVLHLWALSLGLAETGDQLRLCLGEDIEMARRLMAHAQPRLRTPVTEADLGTATRH